QGNQQRGVARSRVAAPTAVQKQAQRGQSQTASPSYLTEDERDFVPRGDAAAARSAAKSQAAGKSNSQPVVKASASDLLVQAYQLSLSASTEAEYSQIVRGCAEAMRQGLDVESRQFALELSAWALNRRGQLRADQGQRDLAVADFRAALEFDPKC